MQTKNFSSFWIWMIRSILIFSWLWRDGYLGMRIAVNHIKIKYEPMMVGQLVDAVNNGSTEKSLASSNVSSLFI